MRGNVAQFTGDFHETKKLAEADKMLIACDTCIISILIKTSVKTEHCAISCKFNNYQDSRNDALNKAFLVLKLHVNSNL